jgi:hypothetical protein
MANQAFSEAEDLMVGAGELYFKRKDDVHGLHHLGNVEEFNITTDVTTVEKNSSMNRKRELMASVVTAVSPTGSMTMTEYNPYNMALGLFGAENVHKQASTALVNESFTVPSVPGIIELKDADGNRYYNAQNIVASLSAVIPSSIGNTPVMPNVATGSVVNVVGLPAASMTSNTDLYVAFTAASTTAGDVAGLEITWREGIGGRDNVITVSTTGASTTEALGTTGISIFVSLDPTDDMSSAVLTSPISGMKIECIAAKSSLTPDVDYVVEDQSSRAGFIKIPEGSVLKRNDTILISADIPEADYVTVSGGNAGEIEGELVFIGDPNQGDIYNLEAWDVKIQPDGDLTGLIGSDFGSFNLNVKFLADYKNHRQYPYYKLTKVGSASGTEVAQGVYDPLN